MISGRSRLEFLRARVSLLDLARQSTRMRHYGRTEWVGLCCFHAETNPSLFVNVEAGRFFCHGCQAGGDAFRFIEILCACDFREAVRQVARIAKGKPLSLPTVGIASLHAIGAGRGVGETGGFPTSERAERLRAARGAHRRAVAVGAFRALVARELELPLCMRSGPGNFAQR